MIKSYHSLPWNTTKTKQKHLNRNNISRSILKLVFNVFVPSLISWISKTTFPTGWFFAISLWPLNGIFWHTQFLNIYNGSDSFPGFLNFSLCVEWNTLFNRTSLHLYYCFILVWFLPFKIAPFCVPEKIIWNIVCETTKVNISNLLRGWQITRSLKEV